MNVSSLSLNFQLQGTALPEWLPLIPAGDLVGRDGRRWRNANPQAVVDAFSANRAPLPIDYEHATELRGPKGEEAPAAGWIESLELRDGAIWGRVEWTPRAAEMVKAREYRFYSPAFLHSEAGVVTALSSVGLTNKPNLEVPSLNRNQETPMSLTAIRQALGLNPEATEADAVVAINQLKTDHQAALNRAASPPLDQFVPKADHELALNRATAAEQKLAAIEDERRGQAIEDAIQGALDAKKIAPASADYYRAMCRTEGGLDEFTRFIDTAPAIVPDSGLDNKKPAGGTPALNSEERQVAAMLGVSDDDFIKAKQAD